MSRRSHAPSEVYADEREYYSSRREAPRSRAPVAEYDEVDIRERRRTAAPEPDFLREDYGRRSDVGQLVVRSRSKSRERLPPSSTGRRSEVDTRDEIIIRDRSVERPRRREVLDEEVIIAKSGREKERPRKYDEVIYYPEHDLGPQQVRREREDYVYRERDRERERDRGDLFVPPPRESRGQDIRYEREDYEFRPKIREPSPEHYRESITIKEKDRERPRFREEREDEIIIKERERERERPRFRDERDEEIIIREKERERPRFRDEHDEEIIIRDRERERPRYRDEREEEFIFRDHESERPRRTREEKEDEIIIRRSGRSRERPRYQDEKDEEITIRRDERSRGPPRSSYGGYEEDEIIFRDREREIPRRRARSYERDSLKITNTERDRPRAKSRGDLREDELIIRRNEGPSRAASHAPSTRGGDYKDDELIIRRDEREREPPRRRERSRDRDEDDIIVRRNDDGRGGHNDEIIIRRNNERSPSPEPPAPPPPAPAPEPVKAPPIVQEIITHHRHIDHGFERAPEPPRPRTPPRPRSPSPVRDERIEIRHRGTSRNGRQYDDDIILQRETGSRRRLEGVHRGRGPRDDESTASDHKESRELTIIDSREQGRRFKKQADPRDRMWTEITRNLVSAEAIKERGYEFEETPQFYYIMKYLKYEDVDDLIKLTEDIKQDRKHRIHQIQDEREFIREDRPRRAIGPPGPQWDEEVIHEREIYYDGGGGRRYR